MRTILGGLILHVAAETHIMTVTHDLNSWLDSRHYDLEELLDGKNITEIRGNPINVVARLSPLGDLEPEADDLSKADGSRLESDYVSWGQDGVHTFKANDVCTTTGAVIILRNDEASCQSEESVPCSGFDAALNGKPVIGAFCPSKASAGLLLLGEPHGTNGGYVSVFGDDTVGGSFPTDPDFMDEIETIGLNGVLQVVGNAHAMSLLKEGGTALAWGDPDYGGTIPPEVDAGYVKLLIANDVGFAGLTTTGHVVSWGAFGYDSVPQRIDPTTATETVVDIVGAGECFAALTSEGGVATWGGGTARYCMENGAYGDENYISYQDVEDQLRSGIVRVVVNEHAFAAYTEEGDVITWGEIKSGGSKVSEEGYWVESDIRFALPETAVATRAAFSFLRADGRVIAWGHEDYGGRETSISSFLDIGSTSVVASEMQISTQLSDDSLVLWPGVTAGHYTVDSASGEMHHIDFYVVRLASVAEMTVAYLGYTCQYSEWSEWTECDAGCGPGTRTRTREIEEWPLNTNCDFDTLEAATCDAGPCQDDEVDRDPINVVPIIVVASVAGVGVLGCLLCMRSAWRRPEETL